MILMKSSRLRLLRIGFLPKDQFVNGHRLKNEEQIDIDAVSFFHVSWYYYYDY